MTQGTEAMQAPTYQESVRIGWSLLWRSVGSFLLLLFITNVLLLFVFPELTRSGPSLWVAFIPVGVATVVSVFLIMPHVVRALVRKPFRGFHLAFVRESAEPAHPRSSSWTEER